jgi:2-C-methyl-D-erythritol 4-phosphate cytidylyltransferase
MPEMVNGLNSDVAALVPAAGVGERLGLGPKAFLSIGGVSLVKRVVTTLTGCVGRVLVGVPPGYLDKAVAELGDAAEVYPGGDSRQSTIYSLLQKCTEPIVVINDCNRPFASRALVLRVIEKARKHGAAIAFTPAVVPFASHQEGLLTSPVPSRQAVVPQSPQAFLRETLERSYQSALEKGFEAQTTWELVLRLGGKIFAVRGEETNIKITSPLDWELANKVIAPIIDKQGE